MTATCFNRFIVLLVRHFVISHAKNMQLSKFLKYAAIGALGFIVVGEIYHQIAIKVKEKFPIESDDNFTEIVFIRQPLNYQSRLTKHIIFSDDKVLHAAELLVNLVLSANRSIHLAMYIFTSIPLVNALKTVKDRNVQVMVMIDQSMEVSSAKSVEILSKAGIPIRICPPTMHHKVCLIDVPYDEKKRKLVPLPTSKPFPKPVTLPATGATITGSLNWTREGLINNGENFIVTTNQNVCEASAVAFYELWNSKETRVWDDV